MAIAYKELYLAEPAAGSTTTLYTVPASTETTISVITLVNNDSSTSQTVKLHIGGSTAADQITGEITMAANQTTHFHLGLTLEAGNDIRATIGATNQIITVGVFGAEKS